MASFGMEDAGEEKAADKNGTSTHVLWGKLSNHPLSFCNNITLSYWPTLSYPWTNGVRVSCNN